MAIFQELNRTFMAYKVVFKQKNSQDFENERTIVFWRHN